MKCHAWKSFVVAKINQVSSFLESTWDKLEFGNELF